jgi:pyrroline-5-carboxylate reductase
VTFPSLVTIHDDNQEIVNRADFIFLTVLPQQAPSVLKDLEFDPERHQLISLVSTAKLQDLVGHSKLDPSRVSKMICLPSIARHQGVCLHCFDGGTSSAPNPILTRLFTATGGVVTLSNERDLESCMMTTCMMGPLYGMMKHSRDWLLRSTNGRLTKEEASYLVIQQCIGAVLDADREDDHHGLASSRTDPDRLERLIDEQTPGGLNEQALANFERLGGLEGQTKVMDAILSRIRGESDGSLVADP